MSLSDQVRPYSEVAPWVFEEIKKLESELSLTKDMLASADAYNQELTKKNEKLEKQNIKFRETLEAIAAKHNPEFEKSSYWLNQSVHDIVNVAVTDTSLARDALEET